MTASERALTFYENVHYIFVPMPDSKKNQNIPSKKLCSLFQYIQDRGVNPNSFVGNLESRPEAWRDSESSISLDLWLTLCRSAAQTLGDSDFGLGFGAQFFGMPTLLGHMMAACRTLRDALQSYIVYQDIELHSWRLAMHERAEDVELRFIPQTPLSKDRLIMDFVLTSTLGTSRRLTGTDLNLRRARFSYQKPANTCMHKTLFPCPMDFGAPETALVVDRAQLDVPVRTANIEVRILLEKALKKALVQHTEERRYSIKVIEAVTKHRGGVTPDALKVARDLGVGIRDLQLKLKQEGTTFRKLKDSCQSEMALDYLRDTALGIKEIAYILGFSDARAFHRAFLRWTGKTPGEVRRTIVTSQKTPPTTFL
ncbi:MAG: AraC family transcriptional regulator [Deltaproteobacteria bacterium]|nr:AraC family transcriptional regulator [Deltaproteobacteria bacterium]